MVANGDADGVIAAAAATTVTAAAASAAAPASRGEALAPSRPHNVGAFDCRTHTHTHAAFASVRAALEWLPRSLYDLDLAGVCVCVDGRYSSA